MLNQGKDIQSISQEIEVSLSTIIGYVHDYVKDGHSISFELGLENFYNEDKKKMILEVCEKVGYDNLNNIKKTSRFNKVWKCKSCDTWLLSWKLKK